MYRGDGNQKQQREQARVFAVPTKRLDNINVVITADEEVMYNDPEPMTAVAVNQLDRKTEGNLGEHYSHADTSLRDVHYRAPVGREYDYM
jgi:hypothetical protein